MKRSFDNGPIQRMAITVLKHVTKLGWQGVEVRELRLDSFKAVIHVEPCDELLAQFEENGFGVMVVSEWDPQVRIVWRLANGEGKS